MLVGVLTSKSEALVLDLLSGGTCVLSYLVLKYVIQPGEMTLNFIFPTLCRVTGLRPISYFLSNVSSAIFCSLALI